MATTNQGLWVALFPAVRTYWNALADFSVTAARSTTPTATTVSHNMVRQNSVESVGVDAFQEVDFISGFVRMSGPAGSWLYVHSGILQTNLYMPVGFDDEDEAFAVFSDRARVMWEDGISIDGFSTYATQLPRDLPAPLPGFVGRSVDVDFKFITRP